MIKNPPAAEDELLLNAETVVQQPVLSKKCSRHVQPKRLFKGSKLKKKNDIKTMLNLSKKYLFIRMHV